MGCGIGGAVYGTGLVCCHQLPSALNRSNVPRANPNGTQFWWMTRWHFRFQMPVLSIGSGSPHCSSTAILPKKVDARAPPVGVLCSGGLEFSGTDASAEFLGETCRDNFRSVVASRLCRAASKAGRTFSRTEFVEGCSDRRSIVEPTPRPG